jgi:hypothetical protein
LSWVWHLQAKNNTTTINNPQALHEHMHSTTLPLVAKETNIIAKANANNGIQRLIKMKITNHYTSIVVIFCHNQL